MSEIPGNLKFMQSHEWARLESDGNVRIGISEHAQGLLGDMVFVELPEVGEKVEREGACAVVESVKAASDIFSPLTGEVVAVNEGLADSPEQVNDSPYENGWLFLVRPEDAGELDQLLDAEAYAASIREED